MESRNIEAFKTIYAEYKNSQDYTTRKKQAEFCSLARKIIESTLKKRRLSNEDLTSFIQLFKPNCKQDNFSHRIRLLNIKNDDVQEITDLYSNIESKGYCSPGKAAIKNLTKDQLKPIYKMLSELASATDIDTIKASVSEFKSLKRVSPSSHTPQTIRFGRCGSGSVVWYPRKSVRSPKIFLPFA